MKILGRVLGAMGPDRRRWRGPPGLRIIRLPNTVIPTRSRHLRKSRPRRRPRGLTGGRSVTSRNRRLRTPGGRCAATARRRKPPPRRRRPGRRPNPPRAPQSNKKTLPGGCRDNVSGCEETTDDGNAAVFPDDDPRRHAEEPHRGAADASIFGRRAFRPTGT